MTCVSASRNYRDPPGATLRILLSNSAFLGFLLERHLSCAALETGGDSGRSLSPVSEHESITNLKAISGVFLVCASDDTLLCIARSNPPFCISALRSPPFQP